MKEKLIFGLVGVGVLGILYGVYNWYDPFYHRTITGKVVSEGSRFAQASLVQGQKFAVLLKPFTAEHEAEKEIAGGDGSAAIECLSTRCAVLQPGMCAEFSCRIDHRVLEPSVVQCKMERQIDCGPAPK